MKADGSHLHFFMDFYTIHDIFNDLEWINQKHSSVQQLLSSQWVADSKKKNKNPTGLLGKLKGIAGNPKFYKSLGLGLLKMYRKKEWVGEWGLAGKKDKSTKDCENTKSDEREEKKKQSRKINKRGTARQWLSRGTSPSAHSWICETVSNTPLSSPDSDTSRGI